MVPLPALPLLPKLHSYFEVEQTKTFMKFFGIALLVQWFLPWAGGAWSWNNFAATLWPLLVGLGFTVLTFVPGLADNLKGNLLFLIAAGAGAVGVLWSFAAAGGLFWGAGFGAIALVTTVTALMLWARNGYSQTYYMMLLSGLIGFVLALLVPLGGGLPLIRIFSFGSGLWGVLGSIATIIVSLAFIGLIVLLVMNVFLKKEEADQVQVERFASAFFVASLLFPVVVGIFALPMLSAMLHVVVISGCFTWLAIWGLVCFFEAKSRGENLLAL
jgi:hypothetical protein